MFLRIFVYYLRVLLFFLYFFVTIAWQFKSMFLSFKCSTLSFNFSFSFGINFSHSLECLSIFFSKIFILVPPICSNIICRSIRLLLSLLVSFFIFELSSLKALYIFKFIDFPFRLDIF